MAELTYTYKDNPFKEGTREYDIWYSAFVHGLNSATKDLSSTLHYENIFPHESLKSFDNLMQIVNEKLIGLWGQRISITFRHFEKEALLYPKEKQWHCTFARWFNGNIPGYDPNDAGFVLQFGGYGDTQVEALQNTLLKIAEKKDEPN